MKSKNKKDIIYVITTEYKTINDNPTIDELKEIFNQKYYKTIMKIENSIIGGCNGD